MSVICQKSLIFLLCYAHLNEADLSKSLFDVLKSSLFGVYQPSRYSENQPGAALALY